MFLITTVFWNVYDNWILISVFPNLSCEIYSYKIKREKRKLKYCWKYICTLLDSWWRIHSGGKVVFFPSLERTRKCSVDLKIGWLSLCTWCVGQTQYFYCKRVEGAMEKFVKPIKIWGKQFPASHRKIISWPQVWDPSLTSALLQHYYLVVLLHKNCL